MITVGWADENPNQELDKMDKDLRFVFPVLFATVRLFSWMKEHLLDDVKLYTLIKFSKVWQIGQLRHRNWLNFHAEGSEVEARLFHAPLWSKKVNWVCFSDSTSTNCFRSGQIYLSEIFCLNLTQPLGPFGPGPCIPPLVQRLETTRLSPWCV